jgi:nucleoside-diphosphate-sugar epimerase
MNKVLLTGASGFIGRHVLEPLIKNGFEVHAISSREIGSENYFNSQIKWHQADLLEFNSIANLLSSVKPNHLLHLAWYTEHKKYWKSSLNFRWVQSSLELLFHFHLNGGERVVMAGSCAEYDWRYGYCVENFTPLLGDSPYATCKISLSSMLEEYAKNNNLSWAWGRIFFLFGPGEHQNRLVPSVIRNLLMNKEAKTTHGNQERDFMYVTDVASAFVSLLKSNVKGAINICSGTPVKLKEIISYIGNIIDREELIDFGSIEPSFNDVPLLTGSNKKLKNEVEFNPRYSVETGIQEYVDWWKKNL